MYGGCPLFYRDFEGEHEFRYPLYFVDEQRGVTCEQCSGVRLRSIPGGRVVECEHPTPPHAS